MATNDERIEHSDIDAQYAEPPVARGSEVNSPVRDRDGVDIPVALPARKGDLVTIEYAEDADIPEAGTTEEIVFLGTKAESVMFTDEELFWSAVSRSDDPEYVDIHGKTTEGAFRFNERLQRHSERVTVERQDTPEFISVR